MDDLKRQQIADFRVRPFYRDDSVSSRRGKKVPQLYFRFTLATPISFAFMTTCDMIPLLALGNYTSEVYCLQERCIFYFD